MEGAGGRDGPGSISTVLGWEVLSAELGFLIGRDTHVLVVLGRSFHQRKMRLTMSMFESTSTFCIHQSLSVCLVRSLHL